MTAILHVPDPISRRFRFRSKPVNARAIMAVIPTCNDWEDLRITLDSLLGLKTPPKTIVVANDNSEPAVPEWLAGYPVQVTGALGKVGPAMARNRGFGLKDGPPSAPDNERKSHVPDYLRHGHFPGLQYQPGDPAPRVFEWESAFDWCYFTDCGCTHDPDLFLKFEDTWKETGDCCVAIGGPVTGEGTSEINDFMTEQGFLNAPQQRNLSGDMVPQAIITANALIAALPFAFLGGFDPAFKEACAEDLDLGIRLRDLGVIGWSPDASVAHRFDEDEDDFRRRFRRYGRGNRLLEIKHSMPSCRSKPFKAEKPTHQRLANLAVAEMQAGYDEAVNVAQRGVLRLVES